METCIICGTEIAVIGEFCLMCYETMFDNVENKSNSCSDKIVSHIRHNVFSTSNTNTSEQYF
jgi:hypothetical protein